MKNKLIKLLTLVLLVIAMLAFSLACSNGGTSGTNGDNISNVEIQAIYDMYVAYAEENGVTPKSYEDWLNTIKGAQGEKGKDGLNGVGVKSATINADGELIVTLTDGKELNLGVVKGKDAPVNTLGLDFFPLDDGTYGVKAGNASYLSEIRIPATYDGKPVTKVLDFFFGSSIPSVKSIVIPEGVKVICDYAFENDYGQNPIESITIPKSVIEIGESAFDCEEDVKVYYNGTLEEWANIDFEDAWANPMSCGGELYVQGQKVENVDFSNKSINPYAFTGCKSLKSIKLPTNLTEISYRMFYNCSSLTSIEIPASVESIGGSAFSGCSSLTSIEIPNSVTSIGREAFYNCSSLISIEMPDSVTSIGDYAFYNCSSLESVTIPEKVESIGSYAFENCRALETINFNATACDEVGWSAFGFVGQDGAGITVTFGDNVTRIPGYIFEVDSNKDGIFSPKITSVTIGEKVTSIGDSAFYNCRSLETINFNATACDEVGDRAFEYAGQDGDGITVTFGDNVVRIPARIFEGYYNSGVNTSPKITSVTIGEKVESIGREAFYNCRALTSIIIPNSVTSIGYYAFYNCDLLTIYCEASGKPSGWDNNWNASNRPIYWAGEWSVVDGVPTPNA